MIYKFKCLLMTFNLNKLDTSVNMSQPYFLQIIIEIIPPIPPIWVFNNVHHIQHGVLLFSNPHHKHGKWNSIR
jgi:hypothetical protein